MPRIRRHSSPGSVAAERAAHALLPRRASSACPASRSRPSNDGLTACHTSMNGVPVTSTAGDARAPAPARHSLLTPRRGGRRARRGGDPGPGRKSTSTAGRLSMPSIGSTTTPSTRRSSPHTFSTSSASCTPSTRMRLALAAILGVASCDRGRPRRRAADGPLVAAARAPAGSATRSDRRRGSRRAAGERDSRVRGGRATSTTPPCRPGRRNRRVRMPDARRSARATPRPSDTTCGRGIGPSRSGRPLRMP